MRVSRARATNTSRAGDLAANGCGDDALEPTSPPIGRCRAQKFTEPAGHDARATLRAMPAPDASVSQAALDAAYTSGNFSELRRLAQRALAQTDPDLELTQAARSYQKRIEVDPIALWMLAFSALLFCAIVLRYVL